MVIIYALKVRFGDILRVERAAIRRETILIT